jgi:hypothetical protein
VIINRIRLSIFEIIMNIFKKAAGTLAPTKEDQPAATPLTLFDALEGLPFVTLLTMCKYRNQLLALISKKT